MIAERLNNGRLPAGPRTRDALNVVISPLFAQGMSSASFNGRGTPFNPSGYALGHVLPCFLLLRAGFHRLVQTAGITRSSMATGTRCHGMSKRERTLLLSREDEQGPRFEYRGEARQRKKLEFEIIRRCIIDRANNRGACFTSCGSVLYLRNFCYGDTVLNKKKR